MKDPERTSQQFTVDIAAMLPRITAEVAEDLKRKALERFSYVANEIMQKEIAAFLQREIVPKIAAELQAKEAEIRAGMLGALGEVLTIINTRIVENAKSRLSGYQGDSLVRTLTETLFGTRTES